MWLIPVALIGYLGFMFGTPYYHNSVFEDRINDIVGEFRGRNINDIQEMVFQVAQRENIPLKKMDIKVTVDKNRVFIDGQYELTVSVPYYTRNYVFHPHFEALYLY